MMQAKDNESTPVRKKHLSNARRNNIGSATIPRVRHVYSMGQVRPSVPAVSNAVDYSAYIRILGTTIGLSF